MDDYLALEPLIIARLNDQISGVTIKSTWGLARFVENFDTPPAILLVLESDMPGEINVSGSAQVVDQVWTCFVIVKDSANEAGPLISQIIKAMNGWVPDPSCTPFNRIKSGFKHEYSPTGAMYFPLAFETRFVFTV